MDKSTLESMVNQGLSTHQMAKSLNYSQTNVMHWLRKFGLKTQKKSLKEEPRVKNITLMDGVQFKPCSKCKELKELKTQFYMTGGHVHSWCKACNNRITYEKQIIRKAECVKYKGGKCIVCGYDKYFGALQFHHLNPAEKEFNIGQLRSYSLNMLKKELDKCALLCGNCHSEVHHGLVDLKNYQK